MSLAFKVQGAELTAEPDGSLWWPEKSALIVADLHLEKATSMARRGALLPPYDTRETLARLEAAIARRAPRLVLSLGDAFHDRKGSARLEQSDRAALERLASGREWLWIAGNHEQDAVPFGEALNDLALGPLRFRHAPLHHAVPGEIAGHYHPKAAIRVHGRKVTRPCFATDGSRLILPAFGAFTGGLDLLHPELRGLFGTDLCALMLASTSVHAIAASKLVSVV